VENSNKAANVVITAQSKMNFMRNQN